MKGVRRVRYYVCVCVGVRVWVKPVCVRAGVCVGVRV